MRKNQQINKLRYYLISVYPSNNVLIEANYMSLGEIDKKYTKYIYKCKYMKKMRNMHDQR